MANILLANPPLTRDEFYKRGAKFAGAVLPPLGIAYIAAMLEKYGHKVKIYDGIAEGGLIGDFVRELNSYDIVGLTVNSSFAYRAKETAKAIKEKDKDVLVAGGGAHANTIPLDLLKDHHFDFSVIGEAEMTFCELAESIDKGKGISDIKEEKCIKGLAFLDKESKLTYTEPRPLIKNIDDIPMPARHLLPMHLYKMTEARSSRHPTHSMMTARGCPFSCTFCFQDIYKKTYRTHSPKRVVDEMELLKNKYGAREIAIWDEHFTLVKGRVIEICKEIKARGLDIPWSCASRLDGVNEEMLKEMRSAGCEFIAYGVESGSERMLKIIKKLETKDSMRKGFQMTKDAGIKIRGYFMLGLYGETLEEMQETIDFAKELEPDVVGFTLWVPFPGTTDYRRVIEDGTYSGVPYWETGIVPEFNFLEDPVYVPKGVTKEQLIKMHRKAYRSFYLRPKYILKRILEIRGYDDIKRLYTGARAILNNEF